MMGRETSSIYDYIRFAGAGGNVSRTETVRPGVHADFDLNDKLMGIEVIDATEIMGDSIEFQLPEQFGQRARAGG